jgi:hypothetical protein
MERRPAPPVRAGTALLAKPDYLIHRCRQSLPDGFLNIARGGVHG